MPRMHMTLGDKGGIGKSFIAALLAQYYLDNITNVNLTCLDMDPKNLTLSRYAGLDVEHIDVQSNGDIDRVKFDLFVNRVARAGDDAEVIVDVGGNIYISLTDYLRVNEVLRMMAMEGVESILHVPIVGAGDLFPTLKTLDELVASTPEETQIAVWINQKNGPVEYNGKLFEESERYEEYRGRIRSVTYIPLWRPDMQISVAAMLEEAVTFNATMMMETFDLMGKQRLRMAQRYLYQAIERSGVCG